MAYYGDNEVLFSPTVNTTVDLTMEIDENSTNDECPSAKAVYDFGQFINSGSDPIVNIKTGEVVTTNDSGHKPLHGLNIYGKTRQNSTPTPDAPIDILGVGESGAFEVGVYGKNIFDITTLTPRNPTQGSTVSFNGDIAYISSANQGWATCISNEITVAKDEKYIIKFKISDYSATTSTYIDIIDENDKTIAVQGFSNNGYYNIIFTPSGNSVRVRVVSNAQTPVVTNTFTLSEAQLELGTQATPYEPCNKQTLEVPYTLHGIPVTSGGNYTDANGQQWICDEVDFENECVIQRIAKRVLTENDNLKVIGNTFGLDDFKNHAAGGDNLMCDTLPVVSYPAHFTGIQYAIGFHHHEAYKNYLYVTLPEDVVAIGDIEAFKTWIASNPITIIYELETPIMKTFQYSAGIAGMYCPLSDAYEELHTNKPNTTIISADNAGQRVAYVADPKLYIDNKFTELQQAIITLGGI